MKKARKVRLGIIGVGNMGTHHARSVLDGKVPRCELVAVGDSDPERLAAYGDGVRKFDNGKSLIRSGIADAVLIATPHYDHTTLGTLAIKEGLHVLVEKPISVHKADCERLIAAYKARKRRKQVFAAMFNQRTDPHYWKVKELIDRGELGQLMRVNWITTQWFRSETYYASGGWRATWAGEGGGVLLNQCPHQLDLIQWLCGMPVMVSGHCSLGKRHSIEVEDEVTAYMEYKNGATGVFIASTGEAPGTNRLEIVGEMGRVVVEGGRISFTRNETSILEYCRKTKERFRGPPVWNIDIPVEGHGGQHGAILRNFVEAILDGAKLVAPAVEGIHSVELGNAMLYSALTGKPVKVPINGKAFERKLKQLIKESRFVKKVSKTKGGDDFAKSFA